MKMNQIKYSNKQNHRRYDGTCLSLTIVVVSSIMMMMMMTVVEEVKAELNPVLNINETFPYLIDSKSGKIIQPRDYMDFENLYSPNDTYKAQETIQGRNYYMLKAYDFANYYQSDYWHYSNEEDLKNSALPVANELRCAQQLDWLERKLINASSSSGGGNALFKPGEQHVQLASYVDSFGHPEAGTYFGHGYWLGSYYECNKIGIDMDKFDSEESGGSRHNSMLNYTTSPMKMRYCIGKAREIDWPEDNYVPRISYKIGLCLPETCQTLSLARHKYQIEKLMRFNMPEYLKSRIILDDMYCLPDKRSPIREFTLSGKIFLALMATWFVLLLVATSLYSCLRRHQKDLHHLVRQMRAVDLTQQQQQQQSNESLVLQSASATNHQEQQQQLPITISTSDFGENDDDECDDAKTETKLSAVAEKQKNYLVNYITHQNVVAADSSILSKSAPASPSLLIVRSSNSNRNKNTINNKEKLAATAAESHHSSSIINIESKVDDEKLNSPLRRTILKCDVETGNDSNSSSSNNNNVASESSNSHYSSSSSLSSWLKGSPIIIRGLQAMSITENMREFQQTPKMLRDPTTSQGLRINLNALDAIKCLCCILVIFGHIVFIHMQHLTNIVHTIELSNEVAPRVLIAFFNFVDTFFIISGMLTAYFIFKRFNKRTFANPIIWIYISLLRLVRLTPVYLLVFWFAKTITVHLSDGPIWDYGTDKNSIKGLCQNDHWWKSLLYLGNVGTMQPLCILPAWSIIIDAQYSLFIPPILFLIFRHKRLGYLGLLVAVIVSTCNMSYQLATQTAVKTSDMAKVRLHVYPLISRFAAEFYNTAWNRLGPIAVGILGGHMLYLYDIGHIRRWPYYMRGAYFKFILILHMLIFILPTIGRFTDGLDGGPKPPPPTQQTAAMNEPDMALFIFSNATIKPIWSIINTIFLLRLITDLRVHSVMARIMSNNIWHCLGKLCFASYLIHYEIILILLKSRQDGLIDPNWWNVSREFSCAFLISTVISYLIYILFEAPINKLIMLNIDKSNLVKEKQQSIISMEKNQSSLQNHHHHHQFIEVGKQQEKEHDDDDNDSIADRYNNCQISDTPRTKSISSSTSSSSCTSTSIAAAAAVTAARKTAPINSNNSSNRHYQYECLQNELSSTNQTQQHELSNMA